MRHGLSLTREYRIWKAMKRRCYNPNHEKYAFYGGRGITVCDRWLHNFRAFLDDMGLVPAGFTLERTHGDGDYEPGNCMWASRKAQANNTRRNSVIEYGGKSQTVQQWSEELGIPAGRIYARINKLKMPPAIALSLGKRSCKGMKRQARTW